MLLWEWTRWAWFAVVIGLIISKEVVCRYDSWLNYIFLNCVQGEQKGYSSKEAFDSFVYAALLKM